MELSQIKTSLENADPRSRLKAICALRNYEPDIAIPLLLSQIKEKDFLVRSFVDRELGKKRTSESFAALLELIKFDLDPNTRAEAANSLSLFGEVSISHLVVSFHQDDNWLLRRSILAALVDLNCPDELFEICEVGIKGEDFSVKQACLNCLGIFASTAKEDQAITILIDELDSSNWRMRSTIAKALTKFSTSQAQEALNKLAEDSDHRVVAATLEKSLNQTIERDETFLN